MWILAHLAEERTGSQAKATQTQTPLPEPRAITEVGRVYSVGRQNCDIIAGAGGASSVSRHHATLHVGKSDVDGAHPTLKLEDKSKFGTFCNDVKLDKKTISLSSGAVVRLGVREAKHAIFRCDWVPTKLCLSSCDAETVKRVTTAATASGVAVVNQWMDDCTHLICNEVAFKVKTFFAIVHGAHIVTSSWLDNLMSTNEPQEPSSYYPAFSANMNSELPQLRSSMLQAQPRCVLFSGIFFLITEDRENDIGQILTSAGARFKLCKGSVDAVETDIRALPASTRLITVCGSKSAPGSWKLRSEELEIPTITSHQLWGHVLESKAFQTLKVSDMASPPEPPTPDPTPPKPVAESAKKSAAAKRVREQAQTTSPSIKQPSPSDDDLKQPTKRKRAVARLQSDDDEDVSTKESKRATSRAKLPACSRAQGEEAKAGSGDSPVKMAAQKRASETCRRPREAAADQNGIGPPAEEVVKRPKARQAGSGSMPVSDHHDAPNYKCFKKQNQSMQDGMAEIVPFLERGVKARTAGGHDTESVADQMFNNAPKRSKQRR